MCRHINSSAELLYHIDQLTLRGLPPTLQMLQNSVTEITHGPVGEVISPALRNTPWTCIFMRASHLADSTSSLQAIFFSCRPWLRNLSSGMGSQGTISIRGGQLRYRGFDTTRFWLFLSPSKWLHEDEAGWCWTQVLTTLPTWAFSRCFKLNLEEDSDGEDYAELCVEKCVMSLLTSSRRTGKLRRPRERERKGGDRMYGPQYNFKFSQIILCMTVWLFFMCVVCFI